MMIFISYRRSDSEDITGRLYDHLERRIGSHSIFKDVDSIPFGADFREAVNDAISKSDIMLVVIGGYWLSAVDDRGKRRLDNQADWVRIEIETALSQGIKIVPVLLNNTTMPREGELPYEIKDLAFRNAARLRPDPDFVRDINILFNGLGIPEENRDTISSAPLQAKSLYISCLNQNKDSFTLSYSLLFGLSDATIPVYKKVINKQVISEKLNKLHSMSDEFANLVSLADELSQDLIPPETMEMIAEKPDDYLLIFHDRIAGSIPWEIISINGSFPAIRGGISRRYLLENIPRRKYLDKVPRDRANVLVVIDPTGTLPGANEEGKIVIDVINKRFPEANINTLTDNKTTRNVFIKSLSKGIYNVVHFSGIGIYTEHAPENSGIVVGRGEILNSSDLLNNFRKPPELVFISASQMARISETIAGNNISLGESFLRSGVNNFISTNWGQADEPASRFVSYFYDTLFRGSTIGTALKEARRKLWLLEEFESLNYVHFGLPENIIQMRI